MLNWLLLENYLCMYVIYMFDEGGEECDKVVLEFFKVFDFDCK